MGVSETRAESIELYVLLTCHNRKSLTLACLAALERSAVEAKIVLSAVLVDDGSSDGTSEEVHQCFPWVNIVRGDGDLFWCRGMHRAFEVAKTFNPDVYLWLNDDTLLDESAISDLLKDFGELSACRTAPIVLVGSCQDGRRQSHSYGGVRRTSHWLKWKFAKVTPKETPQVVDTFDGNLALISRRAAEALGNLDPAYEHAMGDYDFGLRAKSCGVECWLATGFHAVCDDNALDGTYLDSRLSLKRRWKHMTSRKGLPVRSWLLFNRRHGGSLWMFSFVWPYLRVVLEAVVPVLRSYPR